MASKIQAIRRAQRANGPAAVLAIGTANPPTVYEQSSFPDFFFGVTNSDHKTDFKRKFSRLCEKTMIKRRYMYLNEEILKKKPTLCTHMEPSLDERQDLVVEAVPELAKQASLKALKEWGRPKSDITHLIFCSLGGIDMPGSDYRLVKLLGLPMSVNRIMLYTQACHMGASMLRIAKDIVENNKNARVLAVACEMTINTFRGPNEQDLQSLAGQATFGDGSGAVIIGADPISGVEKPIYEIHSAKQLTVPETERAVGGHLTEAGLTFHYLNQLPMLISNNIEKCLEDAFELTGVTNWNDLFWVQHPGTWQIMNEIEAKLGLEPEKLSVPRYVFQEFGNLESATVYFIMDEMRKRSAMNRKATTGDGKEWGIMFGFGPGLSIETIALRSVPI